MKFLQELMSSLGFKRIFVLVILLLVLFQANGEIIHSFFPDQVEDNFFNVIDQKIDTSFFNSYSKKNRWIIGIYSIVKAYSDSIQSVEVVLIGSSLEARIIMKNGHIYLYGNGTMLPENSDLESEDFHTLHYEYTPGVYPDLVEELPPFYKVTYSDLFFDVYGDGEISPVGLEANFVWINFLGSEIRFSSRNGAASSLERVSDRILAIAQNNEDVMDWIANIASFSTYSYRNVRSKNDRWSMHSFGIALDILPKTYYGPIYWNWTKDYYPYWWLLEESSLHYVPDKVVEAFEAEGFAWGGKWIYWDRMHFEYRPEVLIYANSLSNVPNLQ